MKIKKIAYHTPQIDVRGSCTALYDYAVHMRKFYNITGIIISPKIANHDELAISKFSNSFPIHFYSNDMICEIDQIIEQEDCNYLYCIKYGTDDGVYSSIVPTGVHCVFDMSQPHGDIYVAVSSTLAEKLGNVGNFVPHMISLKPSLTKENMRSCLGIPNNAVVFGRHGGTDTFDLHFVRDVISIIVQRNDNIYFVFVNTPVFVDHPQVIFLDKIIDNDIKNKFINTCDAHIEAGSLGHSFGLSCGEFAINGKQIITYESASLWNRAHLDILGDDAIIFRNAQDFYDIITGFIPRELTSNPYREYLPKEVTKQFYNTFIKPCES